MLCSRNRSNLPARNPLPAAISVGGGIQQRVGVTPPRTPGRATHEVIQTSEALRAAGLHHDNREARPAQRVHRLGTHDRGVRVSDNLARFRLKHRPTATGNETGTDNKREEAHNALHPAVIRPRRTECHTAAATLGWASVPE